jgi:hypothetical protein
VFAIVPRVAAIGYLVVAISNLIRVRGDERSAAVAVAEGSRSGLLVAYVSGT